MAIVSVIVGILASLAIPSMMSGIGKNQLQSSMGQVKGALQEAQRSAIKNGKSCWVSINTSSISTDNTRTDPNQAANATTNPPNICITSPVILNTGITLRAESVSGSTITALSLPRTLTFSYRGNPSNTDEWVFVISSEKTTRKSCLAVSSGIGIMRTGTYSGTTCTSSF